MDPLRPSHAFSSDAPDLLRQPSAEDLDAAHQLVSSARGRNSDYGAHEKRPSLSDDQPSRMNAEAEEDSVRQQEQTRNPPANGDSINLGQICR
jgi:hypothetical protein